MMIYKTARKTLFLLPMLSLVVGLFFSYTMFFGANSPHSALERAYGTSEELTTQIEKLEARRHLRTRDAAKLNRLKTYRANLEESKRGKYFGFIRWTLFIVGTGLLAGYLSSGKKEKHGHTNASPSPEYTINASIGNPDAERTGWNPIAGGGANFKTHRLVEKNPRLLHLRTSGLFKAVSLGFMGFGLFSVLAEIGEALLVEGVSLSSSGQLLSLITGVGITPFIFIGLGIFLFFGLARPSVIDGNRRIFTLGDDSYLFERIRGFQVVSELVGSRRGGIYTSYELNMVLADGSRVNVMDHGDLNAVLRDGRKIADLVGVPLWMREQES